MKISHHLDDATLLAYSSGTLEEAFAVLVSCHLEVCPVCRQRYEEANLVGGAMLDDIEPTPKLESGSYGRLLEKISAIDTRNRRSKVDVVERPSRSWSLCLATQL